MIGERLLQRVQLAVLRQSFNRLDPRSVGLDREHHAALHQHTVHEYRAGTAVSRVAADVTAGEIEIVADEMDQEAPGIDLALEALPVDVDRDRLARDGVHQLPLRACATARTESTWARCRR